MNWNVTLGVQNAMRNNHSADFILGIVGAGSGQIRDVLFHPGTAAEAKRPELLSLIHISSPRDRTRSRMPSSA